MPLNDLSLDELTEIAGTLEQIRDAGATLAAYGLNPTFNLTPGQQATITLPFSMPDAPARSIYLSEGPATAEAIDAALNFYGTTETLAEVLERLDQNDAEGFADHEMTKRRLQDLEQCVADLILPTAADVRGIMSPTPSPEAAPDAPGVVAQPEPAPEPEETPPAVEGQAGGSYSHDPEDEIDERAFSSAAPSRPEGVIPTPAGAVADSGGGGEVAAAPEAPAAAVPGSANTLAASAAKYEPWTDDEDNRLIRLIAVGMARFGLNKKAAIATAAQELGRPEAGTAWRCKNKLAARLDAAITAEAMLLAQTEIPACAEPVEPRAEPDQAGDAAVGGHSPAAVQEPAALDVDKLRRARDLLQSAEVDDEEIERLAEVTPPEEIERIAETLAAPAPTSFTADPVTAHLMALTDKGGWTLDRDHELMELSIEGWHPNEIALQLTMQSGAIKPRFDTLTGLYEDATGKKVRRFTREDVFAALSRLTGKAA